MPRRPSARVVMNRQAVDAIWLGYADGMQQVGLNVLERTRPRVPDRPPIGKGLVKSGRATTYVNGQKVAGTSNAPRASHPPGGIITVIGYGFPGRFNEVGTIHQPARPFLTPGMAAEVPSAGPAAAVAIERRLRKVRS